MRAVQRLPALGAARLVCAALTLTLLAAVSALGSYAAIARGAERPTATPAAASRLVVAHATVASASGGTVFVHGLLLPAQRRAQVKLLARAGRQWRTVAVARTARNGHFSFRYRVQEIGTTPVEVRYGGNAHARAASASAGQIVGLEPTVASWYYDQGNTACGFHATYGVANRTLPCGTKVTISYGRRTVVATVDDRGPYVYGRSFDLNQNTARFLGMWGVAQVLASV